MSRDIPHIKDYISRVCNSPATCFFQRTFDNMCNHLVSCLYGKLGVTTLLTPATRRLTSSSCKSKNAPQVRSC